MPESKSLMMSGKAASFFGLGRGMILTLMRRKTGTGTATQMG
ncbi:MAG: hypothetical protein ABJ360_13515 [Roseobacter sp.]